MKTSLKALVAVACLVPLAASAADLNCSLKGSKMTKSDELKKVAKVSEDDAKKAALASVKASGATIATSDLKVEDGCVVYSYDVKVPGKSGAEEVYVDAGTGKVLKTKHESAAKESMEKAVDKMKK